MRYLLDTNTCIGYLNGRLPLVVKRLESLSESDIAVCSIVKMELRYGALSSQYIKKTIAKQEIFLNRFSSLPFDDASCIHAADIRAALNRTGTPIGPNDLLIAAIARANNLILVTHNTKEFSRVTGLVIEDWETISNT